MTVEEARKRYEQYKEEIHWQNNHEHEDALFEVTEYLLNQTKNPWYSSDLGSYYYDRRQFDLALKYYEMTYELGDHDIAVCLGYIWYYGRTGTVDYEKAFRYFSEAAALGNDEGKRKLADMYKNGYFVEPDYAKYCSIIEELYEAHKNDKRSLSIPEKSVTAIVGPSGGGKTTLVNLLARFWDVDKGTVSLGGRDVRDYDMDSLMSNFSFVFQNVYLFHDTIADNIRFGQPEAPMEEVIAAAKKACCHDFIMALPDGYDTIIREGGASLSGGEKQRISIARAMMKDAPVIFLVEATANVEPENEHDLMEAIRALTNEKTVIMIAHRLKTVEHADQILVIDQGKIVQQGTHAELLSQEGIYRNFIQERREAAGWKIKEAV